MAIHQDLAVVSRSTPPHLVRHPSTGAADGETGRLDLKPKPCRALRCGPLFSSRRRSRRRRAASAFSSGDAEADDQVGPGRQRGGRDQACRRRWRRWQARRCAPTGRPPASGCRHGERKRRRAERRQVRFTASAPAPVSDSGTGAGGTGAANFCQAVHRVASRRHEQDRGEDHAEAGRGRQRAPAQRQRRSAG